MDLINDTSMAGLAPLDQDVIGFDVNDVLAVIIKGAGCIKEIGPNGMHNLVMVQLSKTTQCIFQNPFRE